MGAQLAWLLNMTETHTYMHAVVVPTYVCGWRICMYDIRYICTMVVQCPLVHTRDTYVRTLGAPLDNVIRRPLYRLLQYARIID